MAMKEYSASPKALALLEQHVAFLSSSQLVFSQDVLFVSRWCIHIVVLTLPQIGRYLVLFYQRDQISILSIICL